MASEGVFQQQIKSMMYVCGDVRHPNTDSAQLVEEFTRHQLREIVSQAAHLSNMRGGRMVQTEDLMFLLRKDKDQLRRLVHHMEAKVLAKRARSTDDRLDDGGPLDEQGVSESHHSLKKIKLAQDSLTPLQRAALNSVEMDTLESQRLERQDELTSNMSTREYLEYTACRGISLHKDMTKFKDWLGLEDLSSVKLGPEVLDLVGHLANETVRKLVELSLQVRSDMESKIHTVRQCPSAPSSVGPDPTLIPTPSTQSRSSESAENGAFVLGTPPSSPPANILSSPPNTTEPEPQFAITSSSLRRSSREARRRQRTSQQQAPPAPDPEPIPAVSTPPANKKHAPRALKPVHMREATRRLSQHHLLNPLWTHHSYASAHKRQKSWCL